MLWVGEPLPDGLDPDVLVDDSAPATGRLWLGYISPPSPLPARLSRRLSIRADLPIAVDFPVAKRCQVHQGCTLFGHFHTKAKLTLAPFRDGRGNMVRDIRARLHRNPAFIPGEGISKIVCHERDQFVGMLLLGQLVFVYGASNSSAAPRLGFGDDRRNFGIPAATSLPDPWRVAARRWFHRPR